MEQRTWTRTLGAACNVLNFSHFAQPTGVTRLNDCNGCHMPHATCYLLAATCCRLPVPVTCNLPAIIILNNTYKSLSCLTTSQTSLASCPDKRQLANWQTGEMALTAEGFIKMYCHNAYFKSQYVHCLLF